MNIGARFKSVVDRMLGEMGWNPTEVVGRIEAQNLEIRADHLAAAAVMAGGKFSAVIPSWVKNREVISRVIEWSKS